MGSSPIRRSNYLPPDVGFDCVNDGRAIDADFTNYHAPLSALHNQAVHGLGVAAGLALGGTLGQAGLTLSAGVALDAQGRTIVLPQAGGTALIEAVSGGSRAAVAFQDAVNLPTQGLSGDRFVTIEYHEELVSKNTDVAPCKSWEQQPILRFRPLGPLDPASAEVIVGSVTLDAAGLVQGLSSEGRPTSRARLGSLQFARSVEGPTDTGRQVIEQDGGWIACLPDGSLRVNAPNLQVDHNLSIGGDLRVRQLDALTTEIANLTNRLDALTTAFKTLYDGDLHPTGTLRVPDASKLRKYHFPLWTIHHDPSGGPLWDVLRGGLSGNGSPTGLIPLPDLPNGTKIHGLHIQSTASPAGPPAMIRIALNVLDHQTGTFDSSRLFMIQAGGNFFTGIPNPIVVDNTRYSYDLYIALQATFVPTQSITLVQDISIDYDLVQLY